MNLTQLFNNLIREYSNTVSHLKVESPYQNPYDSCEKIQKIFHPVIIVSIRETNILTKAVGQH